MVKISGSIERRLSDAKSPEVYRSDRGASTKRLVVEPTYKILKMPKAIRARASTERHGVLDKAGGSRFIDM